MARKVNQNRLTSIYTLEHPLTGEIRYVGKTVKSLKARLIGHISSSYIKRTHTAKWIQSLLKSGIFPIIKLLEIVIWENSQDTETYWISQFKQWGFNLTNHSSGGEGILGVIKTEEQRKRLSIAIRSKSKSVYQYDLKGNFIKSYRSCADAACENGFRSNNISQCCRLKKKSHANYIWSYLNPEVIDITKYSIIPVKDRVRSANSLSKNNFVLTSKKVEIFNKITKITLIVDSIQKASILTGKSVAGICCECKNTRKVKGDYNFKYYECT